MESSATGANIDLQHPNLSMHYPEKSTPKKDDPVNNSDYLGECP